MQAPIDLLAFFLFFFLPRIPVDFAFGESIALIPGVVLSRMPFGAI